MNAHQGPLVWTAELNDGDVEAWVRQWFLVNGLGEDEYTSVFDLVIAARKTVPEASDGALELRLSREGDQCRIAIYSDGRAHVSCSLRISSWETGVPAPDLRTLNASLKRQKAALRRSNQDLERFAAAASHDLKAPLGVIRTYGTVLSRIYAGESSQRYADGILSATSRLTSMLDGMLRWARVDGQGDPRPFDMPRLVQEVLENLEPGFGDVDVTVEFGDLPGLAVARVHALQVFQNLIDNAFKYRQADAVNIRIDGRCEGPWVDYSVCDDGRGIPVEHQQAVFELFRRLEPEESEVGAGVGLALVTRIVERYSGTISVTSAEGSGSTFHIRLPAA